jgi:hypothetical protein
MKKSLYVLMAFAAVTMTMVGCSKKGSGGVGAYVPGSCYNRGTTPYNSGYNTGYNPGYNNGYSGVNGYQYINGQCIDTRTNTLAPNQNLCAGVTGAYSGAANCNYYGGYSPYYGSASGAYNACSVYNNGAEQFYPVYYPSLGMTVCAGFAAYNTIWSYGTPSYYSGYNNVFQGCIAGSDPRCQTFGGTMGWFHGGVQLGVYF